jgi:hypothetical protein
MFKMFFIRVHWCFFVVPPLQFEAGPAAHPESMPVASIPLRSASRVYFRFTLPVSFISKAAWLNGLAKRLA